MSKTPFQSFPFPNFNIENSQSQVVNDGVVSTLNWQNTGSNQWECCHPTGLWRLKVEASHNRISFIPEVKLNSPIKHLILKLITVSDLTVDQVYGSGIKMGNCHCHKLPVNEDICFKSFYTCALTRNKSTLMITHPLEQKQYSLVECSLHGNCVSFEVNYKIHHYSKTDIQLDPVTFRYGDGIAILQEYANECQKVERDFSKPPQYGWNSWDYYRWTISEDEVLKNAEFIAKDPVLSKHIKRIIVDDGWQYCYGEWDANKFFPSGMKSLANEIKKLKFIPGLWLAPSIVEPHSIIAQLKYDMLAQSENGQPCLAFECMKRYGFVLDPTVEKSRQFLKELFDRYASMGYEYFKLDFLERTMDAAKFADTSVPRSKIIAKLMEPIVEGVANRAEIMGCNYPFMAGNRYVTATRIGADIHASWNSLLDNTPSVAYRFWMNKKLWINDPDFALCRGVDTSNYPETLQPCLVFCQPNSPYNQNYDKTFASATLNEIKTLLSVVLMAGGAVNLSDDLTKLNATGLDLARKIVSAESGESAIPLDLFYSEFPCFWLQKLSHGGRLLIVNWQNEEKSLDIPQAAIKVMAKTAIDFWSGKSEKVANSQILAPHSCKLLQW